MLDELQAGRESYRRRAWADAHRSLSLAASAGPIGAGDLELLASAAYLTGRDADFHAGLERAHHAHLGAGARLRAARCAFWIGLDLLLRGLGAEASGWLGRSRRLVGGEDCVEKGYLLVPEAELHLADGAAGDALAAAAAAAEIGDRFGDPDLSACARHVHGRILLSQGQVRAGFALLDEAMLAVVTGELSPIMTGLVYCSVIGACQELQALGRAREWTAALARWCEEQPQIVAFTSTCLVHRAEIMQLNGAWADAIAEACRACERRPGAGRGPPAAAFYRRGELHRLRGELAAAEEAYRTASRLGCEPQPGLALLRLAQGRADAAAAAIRRVAAAATEPLLRARVLPAHVEIALALGELEEARGGCETLEQVAARFDTDVLRALAAHARGAVELAEGDARAALGPLRQAFALWQRVEAPYEAACVRVRLGLACRSLGDGEAAELELDAAGAVFEALGAAPDRARLETVRRRWTAPPRTLLSRRELQVLRLVAAGKTNRAIATELRLSERTIDRHVSNIFRKLNVPSRAAATAHAFTHALL
jgi:ATP/maltotriose-dependent transcriptional regulator MalT